MCHHGLSVYRGSHDPVSLTNGVDAGGLTTSRLAYYYHLEERVVNMKNCVELNKYQGFITIFSDNFLTRTVLEYKIKCVSDGKSTKIHILQYLVRKSASKS